MRRCRSVVINGGAVETEMILNEHGAAGEGVCLVPGGQKREKLQLVKKVEIASLSVYDEVYSPVTNDRDVLRLARRRLANANDKEVTKRIQGI